MHLAKPKLLNLRESVYINTVEDAYKRVIKRNFNALVRVDIKPGSKTAVNCRKFVEMSNSVGRSPHKLIEEAMAFFDEDFCRRVTGRPFPQVTFVISEKTQARLLRQNKPTVKITNKNFDAIAEQYIAILETMDKTMAFEAVRGGWPEGSPRVRKILLKRLKHGS